MLKLQFRDDPERVIKLTVGTLTLGCDPSNDLVIEQPSISDFHAEIVTGAQAPYIIDLLSAAGTFVNGRPVTGHHSLKAWDTIRLGTIELLVVDPNSQLIEGWALRADPGSPGSQLHPLQAHTVVGRETGCQLAIDNDLLSRRHAELFIEGDHLRIIDLGSSNGTFVNGQRISTGVARPGDELRFDRQCFLVVGPTLVQASDDASDRTRLRGESEDITALEPPPDPRPRTGGQPASGSAVFAGEHAGACLLAEAGQTGPRKVPLSPGGRYRIGRDRACDICLEDKSVSKSHAELYHTGERWRLVDAGSNNGTLVNGRRVRGDQGLEAGDRLQFGRLTFVFRDEC